MHLNEKHSKQLVTGKTWECSMYLMSTTLSAYANMMKFRFELQLYCKLNTNCEEDERYSLSK